jgi:polysaccharide biosynthesis protein PslJ
VEFASNGFIYREAMRLPGLTINTEVINDARSGFDRVHGAASHPIEYAVALAALAPLALNFALHAKTPLRRKLNMLGAAPHLRRDPCDGRAGVLWP